MRIFFTFWLCFIAASVYGQMQYVAPLPGSAMQNPERNIVLRPGNLLDASSLSSSLFTITGSVSGKHDFELILALDGKTINLNPTVPFAFGEQVQVNVKAGLREMSGKVLPGYSFSFTIHREYTAAEQQRIKEAEYETLHEFDSYSSQQQEQPNDGLGDDYFILVNTTPGPGKVWFSNSSASGANTSKQWIIRSDGDSVFERPTFQNGFDWKLNLNGYITAFNGVTHAFNMFDSNYVSFKSFQAVNGYLTGNHEFMIFPDGHHYMLADDIFLVDMTVYDSSYQSSATVVENVVQKFDANHNLLFEWNTKDYFDILEAFHENFAAGYIQASHSNSIEEDPDGNILVSFRNLDQIIKIDVNTGNMIWRLGGIKNQFTFINDPFGFNYQHDARRLPNGNITIFNNNYWSRPSISYAMEYQLDEVNKKATLVWYYQHPDINGTTPHGLAMGSTQRLSNGNTLICYGLIPYNSGYPNMTEVDMNKNIVWELQYNTENYDVMYRAHRNEWLPCSRPSESKLKVSSISQTACTVHWNAGTNARAYNLQFKDHSSTSWTSKVLYGADKLSFRISGLISGKTYDWRVQSLCEKSSNTKSGFSAIRSFKTLQGSITRAETDMQPFNVYPDPATSTLNVSWPQESDAQQSVKIQLMNLMGQIVLSEVAISNAGINQHQINLGSLEKGMYLIRVLASDTQFQSQFYKQ